jgi:hypothetical protein
LTVADAPPRRPYRSNVMLAKQRARVDIDARRAIPVPDAQGRTVRAAPAGFLGTGKISPRARHHTPASTTMAAPVAMFTTCIGNVLK